MSVLLVVLAVLAVVAAVLVLMGRPGVREGYDPKPPSGALVAAKLSDFKTVDNSLVFPRGAGTEIVNITEEGPAEFRFVLRHRGSWYDGDRDLKWNDQGKDKSRAEVSGFKKAPEMRVGETWDIATTVRLGPTFTPSKGYCNIMQPVYDQSYLTLDAVNGDSVTAKLMAFTNGIGSTAKMVRQFTIKRGEWTSIVVRVKFASDGYYRCSVNGDTFKGVDMDTTKGEQPFRSKWGLYGTHRAVGGGTLGDQVMRHKNIYVRKV